MSIRSHLSSVFRLLLTGTAVLAVVFGFSGLATHLVERRVAALTAGGVEFGRLRYDPFSGTLTLDDIRARAGDAMTVFTADRITARLPAGHLFLGSLELDRLRLVSPRLRLKRTPDDVFQLVSRARAASWSTIPFAVGDVIVSDGAIVIDGAGEGIGLRHIDARFGRVAAAALDRGSFALAMQAYGSTVAITGQAMDAPSAGYLVRLRARGADLAGLLADFAPEIRRLFVGEALGDVDVECLLADGGVSISGRVKSGPLIIDPGGDGAEPVSVDGVTVVVDRYDPIEGRGRVSRVDVRAPRVVIARGGSGRWQLPQLPSSLAALVRGITLRRLSVQGGTVIIGGISDRELRMTDVDLTARFGEHPIGDGPVAVTARAAVGMGGQLSVAGTLHPDRDGNRITGGRGAVTISAERLAVARWSRLLGLAGPSDGSLSFDGSATLDLIGATLEAKVSGRAAFRAPTFAADDGGGEALRADAITIDVREVGGRTPQSAIEGLSIVGPRWPDGARSAISDWRVPITIERPVVISAGMLGSARSLSPASDLLRDVTVMVQREPSLGGARVTVTGTRDTGEPVTVARWYPLDVRAEPPSIGLGVLLDAVEAVARR